MSSALDRFERSLVAASRALAASEGAQTQPSAVSEAAHGLTDGPAARRRRPLRRLRSLGLVSQLVVAVASLTVCAGVAVAGYSLFTGGPARELASFECQMNNGPEAIIAAITGSPLVDCAAAWPSASGGQEAAPPLAIWGADNGQRLVAVAGPVSAGPPAGQHYNWRRLPDSWTVDLSVVVLSDQLNNIDLPFNSGATNTCSFAANDIAAVRSLLSTDNLSAWRVILRPQDGQLASGCQNVFVANVDGQNRTVVLMQASPPSSLPPTTSSATSTTTLTTGAATTTTAATTGAAPTPTVSAGASTSSDSYSQAMARGAELAYGQLKQLYASVNSTLAGSCESVTDAAALWTQEAQGAGFSPATLAFWHQTNAQSQLDPNTFFDHYTLYEQPASQDTGDCAHVLVMDVPGSGVANVYIARIAP
jgi:hypothetical protein